MVKLVMDSNNNLEYLVCKYLLEFAQKKKGFISSTIILYSKWIAVEFFLNYLTRKSVGIFERIAR